TASRFGVDDDLRDLRQLASDPLLDGRGDRVRLAEGARRVEGEGKEEDQAVLGLEQAELAGDAAGLRAHDAQCGLPRNADGAVTGTPPLCRLRKRLEMRLHGVDLGQRLDDRVLDLRGDRVRLVERELAGQL